MLRLLVSVRFQVSFTPLVGVLFTFPSRYLCTIGRQGVFRLRGWSPYVQTGFHVPRPTQEPSTTSRLRDYHPLWSAFPDCSAYWSKVTGLVPVRSPLLGESLLMSFPPGTEMFQFPGFASTPYVFRCRYSFEWVSPFGNPRINDCSHLPAAYRSVPRPSSPLGAKASTERSYRAHHASHRPARRTKPHALLCAALNAQLLIPVTFTRSRRIPATQAARAAQRPRYVVTNHSDSPVKQHRHPAQTLLGPFAGQRNLSCRGTCAPPGNSQALAQTAQPRQLFQSTPIKLWRRSVSNRRPPACKAGALPLSYAPERSDNPQSSGSPSIPQGNGPGRT